MIALVEYVMFVAAIVITIWVCSNLHEIQMDLMRIGDRMERPYEVKFDVKLDGPLKVVPEK